MSEFEIPPHHEGVEVAFEDEDTNSFKIFAIGIASLVVFGLMLGGLNDYFALSREALIKEMDLSVPSAQLLEIQDNETSVLQSYKLLDSDKGAYRIPIDRAMRLEAGEAFENEASK